MLFKHADNKEPDIIALRGLLARPDCGPDLQKKIEREIGNIESGVRGEEEAAYEIQVRCGESQNWAVLHDLRVEVGSLSAQMDHLVIDRWLDIWVCESKSFSEGIEINERGEFSALFMGRAHGIASPIEQNAKHILILERLFESGAIRLPKRLGVTIRPNLRCLVLVSKKATITRPKVSLQDIECVIKNDGFARALGKSLKGNSVFALAKSVGRETLHDVGRQLASLHKPIRFNWAAKFGLPEFPSQNPLLNMGGAGHSNPVPSCPSTLRSFRCHQCGVPVSPGVSDFCSAWASRFGGNIFCMPCQRAL